MRLQHFLSAAGICSRRKAEEKILDGLVRVNGIVITELGTTADPQKDKVEVKTSKTSDHWNEIKVEQNSVVYALNKPVGYTSTASDPYAKHTVLELVPKEPRVYPVGRLDEDSSGLIILTNDGDLTFRLTHPSRHVPKTYVATCKVPPKYDLKKLPANIAKLESGVIIDDQKTMPAQVRLIGQINTQDGYCEIFFRIQEGKNRQIRKMVQKIGLNVTKLIRIEIGKVKLSDLNLKSGEFKSLTLNQIKNLEAAR